MSALIAAKLYYRTPQILHFVSQLLEEEKIQTHIIIKKRKHEWIDYCCSLRSKIN